MITNTDAIMWYKVGVFGEAGYAVPNWSDDYGSLNENILYWTNIVGQNLFNIAHHEDMDLRVPPSINTVRRLHKLYVRAGQVLAARAVPPNELNMENQHVRPAGEIFRVYPIPFFKVRNDLLRRWCGLVLISLAEAMQHTENRKSMEFSTIFAGQVGQYLRRYYIEMATELFGKTRDEAHADGFLLQESELAAYNPADFFTGTEMTDTVPRLDRVFTEDRLVKLREGIPLSELPKLEPWPQNLTSFYQSLRSDATVGPSSGDQQQTAPVVPKPVGP